MRSLFLRELNQAKHDLGSCCVMKVTQYSKVSVSEELTAITREAPRDLRAAQLASLFTVEHQKQLDLFAHIGLHL